MPHNHSHTFRITIPHLRKAFFIKIVKEEFFLLLKNVKSLQEIKKILYGGAQSEKLVTKLKDDLNILEMPREEAKQRARENQRINNIL